METTRSGGIIPDEIAAGPAAIRQTIASAAEQVVAIADVLRKNGLRRIWIIGNGTSYHTSIYASGLARRLSGPDDPLMVSSTAGDFLAFRPRLDRRDAIVGISSSGEFRDVVSVFEAVHGLVPTIAIVHVAGSTLSRIADHVVLSAGGPSIMPVMTKTFSATLAASALLVTALLDQPLDAAVSGLRTAADVADDAIGMALPTIDGLVDLLTSTEHIFVVGGGLAFPAALEAALKLKEMALVHAEASETWEMMSGPATIVGPGSAVISLAPQGPGHAAMTALVQHCRDWGARTVEVAAERAVADSLLLPISGEADDTYAPLFVVPPIALLAFALARRGGTDPDQPGWVERYHQQGLRHILGS
jgi:glucosamine--fructose-6-phosphate aminotransferase (isomerizing)